MSPRETESRGGRGPGVPLSPGKMVLGAWGWRNWGTPPTTGPAAGAVPTPGRRSKRRAPPPGLTSRSPVCSAQAHLPRPPPSVPPPCQPLCPWSAREGAGGHTAQHPREPRPLHPSQWLSQAGTRPPWRWRREEQSREHARSRLTVTGALPHLPGARAQHRQEPAPCSPGVPARPRDSPQAATSECLARGNREVVSAWCCFWTLRLSSLLPSNE